MAGCKVLLFLACIALAQGRVRRSKRNLSDVEAGLGEFPWQVSLQNTDFKIHFCSGIILDEYHILTSANCAKFSSTFPEIMYVVSRTLNISMTENGVFGNGTRSRLERSIVHEDYVEATFLHNIAIWKLISSEPIELDGVHAAAIKLLPQGTPVVAGTPTQVSGWASKRINSSPSDVLLKADVPIIDYVQCQNFYNGEIFYNEICAGADEKLWDLCEGDEGSALVYNGTLVGVASGGTICGVRNTPGVYTNAARYTDWITSKIGVKETHV